MEEKQRNIQDEILQKLVTSENGFRYSKMKPKDVESDLYNYHLQQLVKKGIVEKIAENYILTEKGRHYVWDIEPIDPLGVKDDKFKIAVTMILLRENIGKKEVLFQTRTREPFAGSKEYPGRGIKRGELILEAAKRGFKEETGLEADFTHIGTVRAIRVSPEGKLINDMFYHVCIGDKYSGELVEKNEFGENYWVTLQEAEKFIKEAKHISNFEANIFKTLQEKDFREIPLFYFEDKLVVDEY